MSPYFSMALSHNARSLESFIRRKRKVSHFRPHFICKGEAAFGKVLAAYQALNSFAFGDAGFLRQSAQMLMSLVRKRKVATLFAAFVGAFGQWLPARDFLTLGPQCPCARLFLISAPYGSCIKPLGTLLAASGQDCHDRGRFPFCR